MNTESATNVLTRQWRIATYSKTVTPRNRMPETGASGSVGAPFEQSEGAARPHCPLRASPIYSVLSLSLPPLRSERVTVFCFRLFRSLVPRSQKSKTKMGYETYPNFLRLSCYIPLAERVLLCLFGFDRIPNHESPFTNHPSTR